MNELEALTIIHRFRDRGVYAEGAAFADALPESLRRRPAVVLMRLRLRLLQGRVDQAAGALAEACLPAATCGERLILSLEQAALSIYQEVAVRKSLAAAEAALAEFREVQISPADRAEAERVHIRILLIAAVYHEIGREAKRAARDRLPGIADSLERGGRMYESLAARLTHAEQRDAPEARLAALSNLAEKAVALDRPGFAGEVRVARSEDLRRIGAPSAAIEAELDSASDVFAAVEHVFGPIDVRRVRAWLALDRGEGGLDELQACLDAYRRIDYPGRMISLIPDLSQRMHERGDIGEAITYRQRCLNLAKATGMGLQHDSLWTVQIDLLMRNGDYGAAIELCQTALAAASKGARVEFFRWTSPELFDPGPFGPSGHALKSSVLFVIRGKSRTLAVAATMASGTLIPIQHFTCFSYPLFQGDALRASDWWVTTQTARLTPPYI